MKKEKQLIKIALQLNELEKKILLGKDSDKNENKISKILENLSSEELSFIDNYLLKNN